MMATITSVTAREMLTALMYVLEDSFFEVGLEASFFEVGLEASFFEDGLEASFFEDGVEALLSALEAVP